MESISCLLYTDLSYDFKKLTDKQTLGEGEFGFVLKAKAKNICGNPGESWVAVKQLKGMMFFIIV